ncbi:MAG: hypothetical protein JNL82_32235 [Myxococcales bacterium]|nr:hypothetical protein [Myxococcales bacterium]
MPGELTTLATIDEHAHSPDEVYLKILRMLRCDPSRWAAFMSCADKVTYYQKCYGDLEEKCKTLEGQCQVLMMLVRRICCTAHINFSDITIDELSDDSQVALAKIVTGLGDPYVDAFPVGPGKTIRLIQDERPGWGPTEIRIDLNLANQAVNYLDYQVQFYLGPGEGQGKKIGPLYTGNQFLHKDGKQMQVKFPTYKNQPIVIGSLEKLAVEITNKGIAGNLDSAQVILPYDNQRFYEMCAAMCRPGATPGCTTGAC